MGRRRRRDPQRRAEGRVRGRVRQQQRGGQGRPQGRRPQGPTTSRGGGSTGRTLGDLDVGEIQGYANRLKDQLGSSSGGSSRSGSGFSGSGLSGAASGLAGAAAGLAGGGLAQRFTGGSGGSDEDFRNEVGERLDLMDERLRRLEEEVSRLREGGSEASGEPAEPAEGSEPETGL